MITSPRVVGGRKLGTYSNSKYMRTATTGSLTTWVLSNGLVTFTFEEDYLTGVRLKSWKTATSATTFKNESRSLWSINVIRDYNKNVAPSEGTARLNVNHYNIYPRKANFNNSVSVTPESFDGGKRFTFVWNDIKFDKKNPTNGCRVYLIATLLDSFEHLDVKVEVEAQPGAFTYTPNMLENFNSACVTSIQFPTISIKKNSSEAINEKFILSTPVGFGYTYFNPFKYLRTPRYLEESFQYTHLGTRCLAAGFVGEPTASLQRYNYGSPGGFQFPAVVFGNKQTLDGTLIYALDREGTNPKGFQFYFDDENFHFKTYHMSDYQVDPHGLGGYRNETLSYSIENKPTWSFRIRPFKSPTNWLDWYGFDIYRKEAVREQEQFGWLGKSLYDRYINNEISKSAAEMPMVMNVYGYTTGSLDNLQTSVNYYKELYRTSINPNVEGDILFPIYYTPASLNYQPSRSTDPADKTNGAYYGWYTWAHQGTGIGKVGPELFKSPDYTGVNSFHTGAFTSLANSGDLLYSYNKFPFIISSGSIWTNTYSGMDLCVKSLGNESDTITKDQYKYWAYSGAPAGVFSSDFTSCFGVDIVVDKYLDISSGLSSKGIGIFHDTAGVFGRGCYAKEHKHYNPSTLSTVSKKHPRAGFSKYFNDLQVDILKRYNNVNREAFDNSFGEVINSGDFIFKQCAEFPTDTLLKDVPVSLTYEPLGPIYNFYFNKISNPRPDAIINTIGGLEVESLDDATIAYIIATFGVEFWSAFVKSPNWIQRCPSFQIAFSDRAIWDEWTAVHNTNAFSSFFKRGAITGVGPYAKVLKAPITDEYQALNWASFTAQTWPYTNRLSTWHVDKQLEFLRPDLAPIESSESTVFETGIWSGYVNNFSKKLLRIQAYNPDYIYHGSLQHPLDLFSTEQVEEGTESKLLRRCTNPNTGDPYTSTSTVDKIQHIIRKHRNEENYLIIAGNWFSGSGVFSGVFNPASYAVPVSYQVYSLELNNSNHGTKTLIATKAANETFSFTASLNEYDYIAYEIETNSTILNPNIFGDVKTEYIPVRYSYDILNLLTNDTTFAYSYGTTFYNEVFTPQVGFKAAATQDILNNLPPWMKMRQSYDSNGWKLTNSWGMGMEDAINGIKNRLYDFNLNTADTKSLYKLEYVDIDSKELLETTEVRNLLFNSSFSIKDVARSRLPAGWKEYSTTTSCYIDYKNTITTPCSITSDTGKIKLGQQVLLNNVTANSMTASVYVQSNAPNVSIKLYVSIEKMDGTSLSFTAQTSNRSSEWVRLVLPVTISSQVYRVNYAVISNCSGKVSIAAPQLEFNSLSRWTSSPLDVLPFIRSGLEFNTVYAMSSDPRGRKIPIYNINIEKEFLDCSIPTRVEKALVPRKEVFFVVDREMGRKVDNQGYTTTTEFTVFDGKISERSLGPSIFDFFGKYNIRELRFYEDLEYGTVDDTSFTIEPLATAIRKDYLFVACKEISGNKVTRTLKVVRPRTPPSGQTYLESFIDFDLELDFSNVLDLDQITDEEIDSISFSDTDPNYMVVVTTNNVRYYYKLYFDYFYFNSNKNRVYTIEKYNNSKIVIL